MIVNYKTILNGNLFDSNSMLGSFCNPDDVYEYVVLGVQFCCEKMEGYWNEYIGFGEWREYPANENTAVNFYHHCGDSVESILLKFCPFCGKLIITIEKDRIKLVKHTRTKKVKESYHTEVKVK